MKIAVACICLSLFVASNAFILQDNMMRNLMTLNLMQNRNPFDFSMLGLGGDPQAQGQGAPAGASQGAPGAQQQPPQDQAAGLSGGLFSNPLIQLSILGDGMLF